MSNVLISVCSRKDKIPSSLEKLQNWCEDRFNILVAYDAPSIYEGHKRNIETFNRDYCELQDDDIFLMIHDDVEILSDSSTVYRMLSIVNQPKVGFVGVAGGTRYDNLGMKGAWWNARSTGDSRGFVFQGSSVFDMIPNYFGHPGQVVTLDGLFLATSYKYLKEIGLEKPIFLSSHWDFYDIYLSLESHLKGKNNYVVPIIVKHESPGHVRPEWEVARTQFVRNYSGSLPVSLPYNKTTGFPWNI